ncbi:MAG TPA: protein kinase [Aggregatilineales bacterium]|nr:protein kinase [Aggregatilineales bacterium]
MDPFIGQKFGEYNVISKLGKGGMATVYRARQTSVERDVAIKIIRSDKIDDPLFGERFTREARTIARLSHPHILKVFGFGHENDVAYLVMELLEGGSLAQLLRASGAIPLEKSGRMLDQIAGALDYAHQQGIIHRDLKPDNVLLDKMHNAFLTDFGIAKLLNETTNITQTGMVMGTPAYMAPELWNGARADNRSDVYALGVILFEMLTGRVPYAGDTPFRMMAMHVHDPLPSISALNPAIPSIIDPIFIRSLAKNPDERFVSAGQLAESFRSVILTGNLPAWFGSSQGTIGLTNPLPVTPGGTSIPPRYPTPPVGVNVSGGYSPTQMPGVSDGATIGGGSMPAPEAAPAANPRRGGAGVIVLGVIALALIAGIAALVLTRPSNGVPNTEATNQVLELTKAAEDAAHLEETRLALAGTVAGNTQPTATFTATNTATGSPSPTSSVSPTSTPSPTSSPTPILTETPNLTVEAQLTANGEAAMIASATQVALNGEATLDAMATAFQATFAVTLTSQAAVIQTETAVAGIQASATAAIANLQATNSAALNITGTAMSNANATISAATATQNALFSMATATQNALFANATLNAQGTSVALLMERSTIAAATISAVQTNVAVQNATQGAIYALGTANAQMTAVAALVKTESAPPPNSGVAYPTTRCSGFMPSRLIVGAGARITPGEPNILRDAPGTGNRIGALLGGSLVTVMEGPQCTKAADGEGLAWWKVNSSGQIGWTAEGKGLEYWVEPAYDTGVPGGGTVGVCGTSPATRLKVFGYGRVTPSGSANLLNSLAGRPSVNSSITTIARVAPSERFRVLGGPICNHGITWYEVEYKSQYGWMGESDSSGYWSEPVASPVTAVARTATPKATATTTTSDQSPPAYNNRNYIPAGAVIIGNGEFQVEQYCTARGYKTALTNSNKDWACTNADGSTAFTLTAKDFDTICQGWYSEPRAFALQVGTSSTLAYNWRCYRFQ